MLKKMLQNKFRIIVGLVLVLLLILIRAFENQLFYDPFLSYFKSEYTNIAFPKINTIKLFLSLGFRYYLNSIISLGLLYLIFNEFKLVKFSTFLYVLLGSIVMISFFFVLLKLGESSKMTLFYIRRFIIQPIFLMLFIPAFYYQKKIKK